MMGGKLKSRELEPFSKSDIINSVAYDYRVSIDTKTILLSGNIDEYSLDDLIVRINFIQQNCSANRKDEAINLLINSYGGDVYEMFGIIDFFRIFPVPINTIAIGKAMSAAAMILAMGTGTRKATAYSSIMLHESSGFLVGKFSDQKANMIHSDKLEKIVNDMLESRTKKNARWWKEKQKTDFYISPEEAVEYGIIDEVI